MIKYLELTAPESDDFRQAKIISIEINEGDEVAAGDALFMVLSRGKEIALPSKLDGKIIEIIALKGENISVMTPLVLMETETEGSTATPPIIEDQPVKVTPAPTTPPVPAAKKAAATPRTKKKKNSAAKKVKKKNHTQQSLDLSGVLANINSSSVDQVTNPQTNKNMKTTSSTVTVPDIGTESATIVEIIVKVGDVIAIDDPILSLESDKASMELPSDQAGTVSAVLVAIDQEVSQGVAVIELQVDDGASTETPVTADPSEPSKSTETVAPLSTSTTSTAQAQKVDITVPDIGGDSAKVIEILVSVGDVIAEEDPLITLESDKASMEVPSTASGTVQSIDVEIDQDVSQGLLIATVLTETGESVANKPALAEQLTPAQSSSSQMIDKVVDTTAATQQTKPAPTEQTDNSGSHASPSVRRFARELGAPLSQIKGSGRKGRIGKDDVAAFVKQALSQPRPASAAPDTTGNGIPAIPAVDFSRFGEIELQPLSRIKKLTAANLHRSWLNVPHVTHNDESNISDLEDFRKQLNAEFVQQKKAIKLSPLAFVVKAVVNALQNYPQFNSSLDETGDNLILKKYVNIGIAVDTPEGLVVPVIKDADKLSISEIAIRMGELAAKARDKKLNMSDISGACFSVSSLGGIGGTGFTPIVNAPEVAILGVSRGKISPVWNGESFDPKLILPLSLSYDHRVIDGAEAARFTRHIAAALEDVRRLAL